MYPLFLQVQMFGQSQVSSLTVDASSEHQPHNCEPSVVHQFLCIGMPYQNWCDLQKLCMFVVCGPSVLIMFLGCS